MVADPAAAAGITRFDVPSERGGSTLFDRRHDATLHGRKRRSGPRDTHLVETALLDMTMHVAKQSLHMSLSYAVTSVNQPLTFPQ